MLGIFISKNGYQKGAKEAAYCTNVLLKDWDGFIELIAEQWLKHRFKHVLRIAYPLGVYTDPWDVPEQIFAKEVTAIRYKELQTKYLPAYVSVKSLEFGSLQPSHSLTVNDLTFEDFNSYFEYLEIIFKKGIEEFEELFAQYPVEEWKLDISNSMALDPCIMDYLSE